MLWLNNEIETKAKYLVSAFFAAVCISKMLFALPYSERHQTQSYSAFFGHRYNKRGDRTHRTTQTSCCPPRVQTRAIRYIAFVGHFIGISFVRERQHYRLFSSCDKERSSILRGGHKNKVEEKFVGRKDEKNAQGFLYLITLSFSIGCVYYIVGKKESSAY